MHFADRVLPNGVQATPMGNIAINSITALNSPAPTTALTFIRPISSSASLFSPASRTRNSNIDSTLRASAMWSSMAWIVLPAEEDAYAMQVESTLANAGSFRCSGPLLDRIRQVNRWTMRCLNLGIYYVDCPNRERMGMETARSHSKL